ncbi:hypothetical protein KSP40_PGU003426 [Platanthera guangdongensis]|uniref:Uncharacterized protein n=1 Tax=Platanthera guangdongensis TaxID=2320717 RepID=A0ABR2MJJ8_9ASPA
MAEPIRSSGRKNGKKSFRFFKGALSRPVGYGEMRDPLSDSLEISRCLGRGINVRYVHWAIPNASLLNPKSLEKGQLKCVLNCNIMWLLMINGSKINVSVYVNASS